MIIAFAQLHSNTVAPVIHPSLFKTKADSGIAAYALRLNSRAGTEGLTVSSLICDRWLILGLETLSISRCLNN